MRVTLGLWVSVLVCMAAARHLTEENSPQEIMQSEDRKALETEDSSDGGQDCGCCGCCQCARNNTQANQLSATDDVSKALETDAGSDKTDAGEVNTTDARSKRELLLLNPYSVTDGVKTHHIQVVDKNSNPKSMFIFVPGNEDEVLTSDSLEGTSHHLNPVYYSKKGGGLVIKDNYYQSEIPIVCNTDLTKYETEISYSKRPVPTTDNIGEHIIAAIKLLSSKTAEATCEETKEGQHLRAPEGEAEEAREEDDESDVSLPPAVSLNKATKENSTCHSVLKKIPNKGTDDEGDGLEDEVSQKQKPTVNNLVPLVSKNTISSKNNTGKLLLAEGKNKEPENDEFVQDDAEEPCIENTSKHRTPSENEKQFYMKSLAELILKEILSRQQANTVKDKDETASCELEKQQKQIEEQKEEEKGEEKETTTQTPTPAPPRKSTTRSKPPATSKGRKSTKHASKVEATANRAVTPAPKLTPPPAKISTNQTSGVQTRTQIAESPLEQTNGDTDNADEAENTQEQEEGQCVSTTQTPTTAEPSRTTITAKEPATLLAKETSTNASDVAETENRRVTPGVQTRTQIAESSLEDTQGETSEDKKTEAEEQEQCNSSSTTEKSTTTEPIQTTTLAEPTAILPGNETTENPPEVAATENGAVPPAPKLTPLPPTHTSTNKTPVLETRSQIAESPLEENDKDEPAEKAEAQEEAVKSEAEKYDQGQGLSTTQKPTPAPPRKTKTTAKRPALLPEKQAKKKASKVAATTNRAEPQSSKPTPSPVIKVSTTVVLPNKQITDRPREATCGEKAAEEKAEEAKKEEETPEETPQEPTTAEPRTTTTTTKPAAVLPENQNTTNESNVADSENGTSAQTLSPQPQAETSATEPPVLETRSQIAGSPLEEKDEGNVKVEEAVHAVAEGAAIEGAGAEKETTKGEAEGGEQEKCLFTPQTPTPALSGNTTTPAEPPATLPGNQTTENAPEVAAIENGTVAAAPIPTPPPTTETPTTKTPVLETRSQIAGSPLEEKCEDNVKVEEAVHAEAEKAAIEEAGAEKETTNAEAEGGEPEICLCTPQTPTSAPPGKTTTTAELSAILPENQTTENAPNVAAVENGTVSAAPIPTPPPTESCTTKPPVLETRSQLADTPLEEEEEAKGEAEKEDAEQDDGKEGVGDAEEELLNTTQNYTSPAPENTSVTAETEPEVTKTGVCMTKGEVNTTPNPTPSETTETGVSKSLPTGRDSNKSDRTRKQRPVEQRVLTDGPDGGDLDQGQVPTSKPNDLQSQSLCAGKTAPPAQSDASSKFDQELCKESIYQEASQIWDTYWKEGKSFFLNLLKALSEKTLDLCS